MGAGCGDDDGGRPLGWETPRDGEISATIDAVWQAIGADPAEVTVAEYAYTFAPDHAGCADLPRDDRWFGQRGSSARLTGLTPARIEDGVVEHLESEGFDVERYRSTHPDSPLRAFLASRDDVVVDGMFNPDGYTTVNVRSGPCAAGFGGFDPELFQPDA